MAYESWARIKAARVLDQLRGGAPRAFYMPSQGPFRGAGQEGRSGGQRKLAAPQRSNTPTLLHEHASLLLKAALIACSGKQPKVTATGESGLPDQIEEKPWSEFGSKACPVSCHRRWQPLPWRAVEKPIAVQPCRCLMPTSQSYSDGEEHSQDWKEGTAQDRRERQTLPLRQVPQTKPEAGEDSRPVVLSSLPQGERYVENGRAGVIRDNAPSPL